MGEIFRRSRPRQALPWTGERLVSNLTGPIESEHLHRYFLARELCRGKDVLDIASGEGYGSAVLAQVARHVIGVDADEGSVVHAGQAYQSANLVFHHGSATNLPVPDQSLDVVVSFETLEHLTDHDCFLGEVRRALRPGGLLVISTPDLDVYSAASTAPNPYHVRELTTDEFRALLSASFSNVSLFRQRVVSGSAIFPEASETTDSLTIFEQRDDETFQIHHGLPRAPYLVALASDAQLPAGQSSFHIALNILPALMSERESELERLRALEQRLRDEQPVVLQELERLRDFKNRIKNEELARGSEVKKVRSSEAQAILELERLREREKQLTVDLLHQTETIKLLEREFGEERDKVIKAEQTAAQLTEEIGRLASERTSAHHAEIERLTLETTAAQQLLRQAEEKLNVSSLTIRRQVVVNTRLQAEMARLRDVKMANQQEVLLQAMKDKEASLQASVESLIQTLTDKDQELQITRRELSMLQDRMDIVSANHDVALRLLIPYRLRRKVPDSIKPVFRVVKRAFHG